jgi:hypothetical protein
MEQQWRANFGAFLELNTEEASCDSCKRTGLSDPKSEIM